MEGTQYPTDPHRLACCPGLGFLSGSPSPPTSPKPEWWSASPQSKHTQRSTHATGIDDQRQFSTTFCICAWADDSISSTRLMTGRRPDLGMPYAERSNGEGDNTKMQTATQAGSLVGAGSKYGVRYLRSIPSAKDIAMMGLWFSLDRPGRSEADGSGSQPSLARFGSLNRAAPTAGCRTAQFCRPNT